MGQKHQFPTPRLSGRCENSKAVLRWCVSGAPRLLVRLSLATMRTAYRKKSQADAIKTLKFSAHISVTPPDASITSHAAPRGAPRPQAYLRAILHGPPTAANCHRSGEILHLRDEFGPHPMHAVEHERRSEAAAAGRRHLQRHLVGRKRLQPSS